ncbi:MAG: hypothetical protein ACT4OX_15635 [Actinomycetota bacterium]
MMTPVANESGKTKWEITMKNITVRITVLAASLASVLLAGGAQFKAR